LPVIEKEFGKYDTAIYVKYVNYIALSNYYTGEYEKALFYLHKRTTIYEKTAGKNHPNYCVSLYNLAELYKFMGRYAEAESLYKEALKVIESTLGRDHPDYGKYLNNLAELYISMGRYSEAESLFTEALQVIQSALGKSQSLSSLAVVYSSMGRYEEAELLINEALQVTELAFGKNHPNYCISLNNLAELYRTIGRYAEAEPLYIEALQLIESTMLKDIPEYGTILNNLALLYTSMGRYAEAESLYIKALQIIATAQRKDHPNFGTILNNLALLNKIVGHNSDAELLYKEALQISESTLGKGHPIYGVNLSNMALLHISIGRYSEAEPLLKEALQNAETVLGNDHPEYGKSLNNLAALYQSMGRYSEAEPLYKEALQVTEKSLGKDHPEYGKCLNNLAELYISMGRYEETEPLFLQANEVIHNNINHAFMGLSEKEKKQYLQTVKPYFKIYHSFVLRRKFTNPSITSLSYNNILINKGMLLQSSLDLRKKILQGEDRILRFIFYLWLGIKNKLSVLYSLPIEKRYVSTDSLEIRANGLEKELNREVSAFRQQTQALQLQWEDVKHSLSENEAAIEFISFRYRNDTAWTDPTLYAALVLRAEDEYPHMIELFEEKQLQKLLAKSTTSDEGFIGDLYATRGVGVVNSAQTFKGDSLYQLIWQPLDSLLEGTQTVYFSPSGLLHQIAFAALPYGEDSLLIDRYQLHQVSSTRVLAQENTPSPEESLSAALFGGILYDTDTTELLAMVDNVDSRGISSSYIPEEAMRSNQLSYLPGTAEEVQNIADQFKEQGLATQLFTGNAALEEQFMALGEGSSPTILHIATHGFFFPDVKDTLQRKELLASFNEQLQVYRLTDDPLRRAGLLLSGANHTWLGETIPQGLEDGILTAYEVAQLNLSNTELVVLSACETGLGEVQGSEGVYGLQRAFKMAGANHLIMSLWKVPDKETQEMMELFYQYYLQEHLPIREAFRKAQQVMREKYAPYYWAAFVLVE